MTQERYDEIVHAIVEYDSELGNKAATCRRQGDPCSYELEERVMALQNVLFALRDYDITWGFLTDDEINQYYELATKLVETCP